MSIPGFLLRAILISPVVFLRYLPILIVFCLIVAALFLSTDNIYVIGMILLILGTMGTSFLVVSGIRAGLMTIRATTAPTAEGLLRVTGKMLVTHLLMQLMIMIILGAAVYYIAFTVILPAAIPGADETLGAIAAALWEQDPEAIQAALPALESMFAQTDRLVMPAILINLLFAGIGAICIAMFGVPMAALSAMAVHYAPQHDLIFGFGRYGIHQILLYLLAFAVPGALWTILAPGMALGLPGDAPPPIWLAVAFGAWGIYAPCLSYAGMAIAYEQVRERLARERMSERIPDLDYEAERESVRSLRQQRSPTAGTARVYDPRAGE